MFIKRCEFCRKKLHKHSGKTRLDPDNSVCNKCNQELLKQEREFKLLEREKWYKRDCRKCGTQLTKGRYYHCGECMSTLKESGLTHAQETCAYGMEDGVPVGEGKIIRESIKPNGINFNQ